MTWPRPWGGPSARSVACSHSCREKRQNFKTGSARVTYSTHACWYACNSHSVCSFCAGLGKGPGSVCSTCSLPHAWCLRRHMRLSVRAAWGTVDVQWTSSGRYSGRPKTGFVAQWTSTLIEEWLSLPSQFDLTSTVRKPRFLDVHCNVHCTSTGRPLCIRYTAHPTREAFFFWLAHAPPWGGHPPGSLGGAQATPPAGGATRATRPGPSMSPPTAGHLLVVVGVSTLPCRRNQEPATCPR